MENNFTYFSTFAIMGSVCSVFFYDNLHFFPKEECFEILKNEPRGVLSLVGDNGYPYGIPMTHFFDEHDGKIYFHGAKEGHKIDAIKKCSKASFCVYDKGFRKDGEWALNIKSVVAFGKITLITDIKKSEEICTHIVQKFTDDKDYLEKEGIYI